MHWIDWTILLAFVGFVVALACGTRKYTRSVADFLAASRCGGRYILAMSDGIAGAISMVAMFQAYYEGGFAIVWWQVGFMPAWLFVAMIGWVIYRFRQTRAFTMAQFFEMRYNKNFRIFAGILAFMAGIINFGIFPSIGAHFFIYFCGLPQYVSLVGLEIDTYGLVMAVLIAIAVGFTFIGGQIAVIVTDFIQAVFCNVVFILILVVLYMKFNWSQITEAISHAPAGQSMVNPFKISKLESYNLWFWLISLFSAFYNAYAWQGQQAYNCSAKDAHEAKMSKVMGFYRMLTPVLFVMVVPVCVYTLMHHADFQLEAQRVNSVLSTVDNEAIRSQITVPTALRHILPVGALGAFSAVIFAAFIGTHDTYLHSWGSILVQDVILPLRKKPFKSEQHVKCLRRAILGVAIFIWFFSYFYSQKSDILMFYALSGTIFLGGAGAAIIGGLYWKRGTTAGAWVAMISGAFFAGIGFLLEQYWAEIAINIQQSWPSLWDSAKQLFPGLNDKKFLFTNQEMFFFAMIISGAGYIIVSLVSGGKQQFNLDRMLHRGQYAIETEKNSADESVRHIGWKGILGFDKYFTLSDKLIYVGSYGIMFLLLGGCIAGSIYNWLFPTTDSAWLSFWHGFISVLAVLTVVLIVWLTIGGFRDLKQLYVLLRTVKRDDRDDGTVVDHHNIDEYNERKDNV
jgi:SSS family solute:Na+ symporter